MKYEDILPYVKNGLITDRGHFADSNIRIFNYTDECQIKGAWDDVTMQCRGLIVNRVTGQLLARPFKKFFNVSEHVAKGRQVPESTPKVYEKLDGSLGVLYWLNDMPMIATRGSFESDQSQWATEHIRKWDTALLNALDTTLTYLFEIIYPANRVVVLYNWSGLSLLGAVSTDSAAEYSPDECEQKLREAGVTDFPWRKPAEVPFTDPASLVAEDVDNAEGYILHWPDEGLRLKVKFPEYIRLHKTMTGLSVLGVWEHFVEKGIDSDYMSLLVDVPDEFYSWVKDINDTLKAQYSRIYADCKMVADEAAKRTDRAELAQYVKSHTKYPAIVFALVDGKDVSMQILRIIRPVNNTLQTHDFY